MSDEQAPSISSDWVPLTSKRESSLGDGPGQAAATCPTREESFLPSHDGGHGLMESEYMVIHGSGREPVSQRTPPRFARGGDHVPDDHILLGGVGPGSEGDRSINPIQSWQATSATGNSPRGDAALFSRLAVRTDLVQSENRAADQVETSSSPFSQVEAPNLTSPTRNNRRSGSPAFLHVPLPSRLELEDPVIVATPQQQKAVHVRSPRTVRPISTLDGEEALSILSAEANFRRPGVKASLGPGNEAEEVEGDMLGSLASVQDGTTDPARLGQNSERLESIAAENTANYRPSNETLDGSYLTITALPEDKQLEASDSSKWHEGEMEFLAAPPPRSSSIPGNSSQESLLVPVRGPGTPRSPSPDTWPAMQSGVSPIRAPLSGTFQQVSPGTSSQQHQQMSASASSSTASLGSYRGGVGRAGPEQAEHLPEKKEGRGTRLRKKTSKLFRLPSKDKEKSEDARPTSPLSGVKDQPPRLFSRTSTATSSSSIMSRSSIGTPTRQRFSTAPAALRPSGSASPPPQITMTRPSTNDLLALQRKTSRSSSSSSMDMPLPTRRTSELQNAESAFTEKKGRLSLPSIKRAAEPTRRRQSSDVASIVSSIGSLRGSKGRAKRSSGPNASGGVGEGPGYHGSEASDSIESLREEEFPSEGDVFASPLGPAKRSEAREIPERPPSIAPIVSGSSFPSRMTAWFTNAMPISQTSQAHAQTTFSPEAKSSSGVNGNAQLTAPSSSTSSPGRRGTAAAAILFNTARQKAVGGMRYLMDVDAQPEGCTDQIWLMGTPHDCFPIPKASTSALPIDFGPASMSSGVTISTTRKGFHRRQSSASTILLDKVQALGAATAQSASPNRKMATSESKGSPGTQGRGTKGKEKELIGWPESFLADYRSLIWCTYRSQYAPISALPHDQLLPNPTAYRIAPRLETAEQVALPPQKSAWTWLPSVSPAAGLTSDSGWGCMLRTGQSMLANALVRLHLGRQFRRTPLNSRPDYNASEVERFATYVQILSWFLDDPAGCCPFSVHRMALIGKQLGKEVGEWFGPSTAAGAIKTLANAFPPCGISVAMATDGVLYRSEVMEASRSSADGWEEVEEELCLPSRTPVTPVERGGWGGQAVLVLAGIRLGLDGVNAVYHDSVRALFTFPQSVGIAGGRPSSSYYFVGTQAESLFYLDPHFTRPAIPLRVPKVSLEERKEGIPSSESSATVTTEAYERDGATADQTRGLDGSTSRSSDRTTQGRIARARSLANAYTEQQLGTFHCDKIKKMPMSGLDPSMLLGFLCRDEAEWDDLIARLNGLKHKILSVQESPPSWADDDFDDGPSIESFSETNDESSVSVSASTSTSTSVGSGHGSGQGHRRGQWNDVVEGTGGDGGGDAFGVGRGDELDGFVTGIGNDVRRGSDSSESMALVGSTIRIETGTEIETGTGRRDRGSHDEARGPLLGLSAE